MWSKKFVSPGARRRTGCTQHNRRPRRGPPHGPSVPASEGDAAQICGVCGWSERFAKLSPATRPLRLGSPSGTDSRRSLRTLGVPTSRPCELSRCVRNGGAERAGSLRSTRVAPAARTRRTWADLRSASAPHACLRDTQKARKSIGTTAQISGRDRAVHGALAARPGVARTWASALSRGQRARRPVELNRVPIEIEDDLGLLRMLRRGRFDRDELNRSAGVILGRYLHLQVDERPGRTAALDVLVGHSPNRHRQHERPVPVGDGCPEWVLVKHVTHFRVPTSWAMPGTSPWRRPWADRGAGRHRRLRLRAQPE